MVFLGFAVVLPLLAVPQSIGSDFADLDQDFQITSADYFDPEEYQVGFGDNIWISFPGGVPFARSEESISTIVLPVGLDGFLSVPGMPPISVDGLNLAELQAIIEEMVRGSYGSFAVTSGLARSANFEIPVTGQVTRPGMITVNGLTRLSEALEEAGGATATAAMSRILIISLEGDSSFYDLNDFTMHGSLPSNPLMHRNTRIHLFPSSGSIVLEGALAAGTIMETESMEQPRNILPSRRVILEYVQGETAASALQRAGGINEEADLQTLFVSRRNTGGTDATIPFDMAGGGGTAAADSVTLLPGDRIVVPFSNRYISVVGQVTKPSSVPYSPGMPVSFYIGMAGGFTGAARQGSIRFIDPQGGEQEAEISEVVPPGVIIEVPRVPIQFWQEYLAILTGVATVIISYQSISN